MGVIGVVGVVCAEVLKKEFWPSLCREALLLCSLAGRIVAFSIELFIVW
jgi:hypothetical protein